MNRKTREDGLGILVALIEPKTGRSLKEDNLNDGEKDGTIKIGPVMN